MTLKKKYLIHIGLFLLVFVSLLLAGTFFDLEISKLLASSGLSEGNYYSTNIFGRFFEYIGSWPIFLLGSLACLIFMHKLYHSESKLRYLAIIFVVIIVVIFYKGYSDTLKYICENHEVKEKIYDKSITKVILWLVSILTGGVLVYFYRNVDLEKNNNLFNLGLVILFSALFYVSIELIKSPVGRMRFRAMNLINDFSYFTPWYEISGARDLLLGNSPVLKDGFKSFPSGHTFSAGISYALICMPYINEKFNNKKWTIIWYVIPITFTGIVGLSRIVAGAHFLTDVLVGGTIAYVAVEVFKYIFIVRRSKVNSNEN